MNCYLAERFVRVWVDCRNCDGATCANCGGEGEVVATRRMVDTHVDPVEAYKAGTNEGPRLVRVCDGCPSVRGYAPNIKCAQTGTFLHGYPETPDWCPVPRPDMVDRARVLAALRELPCERFDTPLDVILRCIRAVEEL